MHKISQYISHASTQKKMVKSKVCYFTTLVRNCFSTSIFFGVDMVGCLQSTLVIEFDLMRKHFGPGFKVQTLPQFTHKNAVLRYRLLSVEAFTDKQAHIIIHDFTSQNLTYGKITKQERVNRQTCDFSLRKTDSHIVVCINGLNGC